MELYYWPTPNVLRTGSIVVRVMDRQFSQRRVNRRPTHSAVRPDGEVGAMLTHTKTSWNASQPRAVR
jgi:hypothetical protein